MNDLLILTRINTLRRNLDRVATILAALDQRRQLEEQAQNLVVAGKSVKHIEQSDQSVRRQIGDIGTILAQLTIDKDEIEDRDLRKRIEDKIQKISEKISHTKRHIESVEDTLENLKSRRLFKGDGWGDMVKLEEALQQQTGAWSKQLESLEMQVKTDWQDGNDCTAMWKEFYEKYWKPSHEIFCEYVDFLSGVTLRELHLDNGICETADLLVRELADNLSIAWKSITIPARSEALRNTAASIVRLGFPEWTYWTLPLTAHEYSHVVLGGEKRHYDSQPLITAEEVSALVQEYPVTEARLRDYLADALATYLMGPAYACAAILLRFDCLAAYENAGQSLGSNARVQIILETLRVMNGQSVPCRSALQEADPDAPYTLVIQWLEQAWMQVRSFSSLPVPPQETLDLEKNIVEAIVTFMQSKQKDLIINPMTRNWLEKRAWVTKITDERLQILKDDPDAKNRDLTTSILVNEGESLVTILNVAWYARLDATIKANTSAKAAESTNTILLNVSKMIDVIKSPKSASTQRSYG